MYVGGLLSSIMSPIIIARERSRRNLYISITELVSMTDSKEPSFERRVLNYDL